MENLIVVTTVTIALGYLIRRYWLNYVRTRNSAVACDSCDCQSCVSSDTCKPRKN